MGPFWGEVAETLWQFAVLHVVHEIIKQSVREEWHPFDPRAEYWFTFRFAAKKVVVWYIIFCCAKRALNGLYENGVHALIPYWSNADRRGICCYKTQ